MPISFHSEDVKFKPADQANLKKWLLTVAKKHKRKVGEMNYVFCSDEYLYELNKAYINHKTYTDIITFEYSTDKEILSDIFISIDRVKDNAKTYGVPFKEELHRVMVHGLLHLLGYKDKKPADIKKIRAAEEKFLKSLKTKK